MIKRLAFLLLAGFAFINSSFGVACDDAQHPIAGKSYTYSVTVDPSGGTFLWYVTSNANLLTGTPIDSGEGILIAGAGYNNATTGTASIDITWTPQAVAAAHSGTPYYLVLKYTTGCSNNVKPWEIQPLNLFSITVENVNSGGGAYADICRPGVSATVDHHEVVYDYGSNALYLKVSAKNFTTSWTPTINMSALNSSLTPPQTVTSIEWSLTTTFTGTSNFDLTTGVATAAVPDKGGDNVTTGIDEYIFIKIVIQDGKFEGTANQSIALNISATDDASGLGDVDKDPATCEDVVENDHLTQTLKARPSITAVTGSFITPQP